MFNTAIHGRGAPRHLSTDHDPLFEAHRWTANLRILEIDEIKTVPHVPVSHPFVERLIGTVRGEFLDHVLFWNARDLERKLADFQAYYNTARSHASLDGHTPLTFADGHTVARADFSNVRWVSHAGTRSSSQRRPDNEIETDRCCWASVNEILVLNLM
jgi:putative transposase